MIAHTRQKTEMFSTKKTPSKISTYLKHRHTLIVGRTTVTTQHMTITTNRWWRQNIISHTLPL